MEGKRRAPHGARGLKPELSHCRPYRWKSRSTRGAWIETGSISSAGGDSRSRSTRGAWIETFATHVSCPLGLVALHTGRVD